MKRLHLCLWLIFKRLEAMTKIASVTTILEAKFTRHKKGQTCVLFKGHLLYL